MILYKYRDLKNFRFFVDILVNQRLYACSYREMNDPMEGEYLYYNGELDKEMQEAIYGRKNQIKICSLSRDADIPLMWAHYSDGGRGIVVEVEIDDLNTDARAINYTSEPLTVQARGLNYNTPFAILSRKDSCWEHEKEMRIFKDHGDSFVKVKVLRIITGQVMSPAEHEFIEKVVRAIDNNIRVEKVEDFRRNLSAGRN